MLAFRKILRTYLMDDPTLQILTHLLQDFKRVFDHFVDPRHYSVKIVDIRKDYYNY